MQWFCIINDDQIGPLTESQLRELAQSGRLTPEDLVWKPSLGDAWVKASVVRGLFDAQPAVQQTADRQEGPSRTGPEESVQPQAQSEPAEAQATDADRPVEPEPAETETASSVVHPAQHEPESEARPAEKEIETAAAAVEAVRAEEPDPGETSEPDTGRETGMEPSSPVQPVRRLRQGAKRAVLLKTADKEEAPEQKVEPEKKTRIIEEVEDENGQAEEETQAGEGMEEEEPRDEVISCVRPMFPAWKRTSRILFSPFNGAKWFALGFCAWLATFGTGLAVLLGRLILRRVVIEETERLFRQFGLAFVLVAVLALLGLAAVALAIIWIRARGRFVLLDNVVNNRADMIVPWRVFRYHAVSLFYWQVGFAVACAVAMILVGAVWLFTVGIPHRGAALAGSSLPGIIVSSAVLFVFLVFLFLALRFVEDFVLPVMYKRDLTASAAWVCLFDLMRGRFCTFLRYGLSCFLILAAAALTIAVLSLMTFRLAWYVLWIPYVSAVLLLPVTVFMRVYSLAFLAQFGEDYALTHDDR